MQTNTLTIRCKQIVYHRWKPTVLNSFNDCQMATTDVFTMNCGCFIVKTTYPTGNRSSPPCCFLHDRYLLIPLFSR
jgi:hypothetical protein